MVVDRILGQLVQARPECLSQLPANTLQIGFHLTDLLGAVLEKHPVDIGGEDRPVGDELPQRSLRRVVYQDSATAPPTSPAMTIGDGSTAMVCPRVAEL